MMQAGGGKVLVPYLQAGPTGTLGYSKLGLDFRGSNKSRVIVWFAPYHRTGNIPDLLGVTCGSYNNDKFYVGHNTLTFSPVYIKGYSASIQLICQEGQLVRAEYGCVGVLKANDIETSDTIFNSEWPKGVGWNCSAVRNVNSYSWGGDRIYRIDRYDRETLTARLVPYSENGQIGVKDLVSGTYLTKMGTNTPVYGEEEMNIGDPYVEELIEYLL
jgi:hypothetical protein